MLLSGENKKNISIHIKHDYIQQIFKTKYSFQTKRTLISPILGKISPEQGPTRSYS